MSITSDDSLFAPGRLYYTGCSLPVREIPNVVGSNRRFSWLEIEYKSQAIGIKYPVTIVNTLPVQQRIDNKWRC